MNGADATTNSSARPVWPVTAPELVSALLTVALMSATCVP